MAYLIRTESDGAHAKSVDSPECIEAQYEAIIGAEFALDSASGGFVVKSTTGPAVPYGT
jgi:hypothetical protein